MSIIGGCYCGHVRYESKGEVQNSIQCHCRECQYITGGSPNLIIVVPEAGFSFTKGAPKGFSRTDLETPVTRFFCDKCGTGFGSISPSRPGSFIVKVGTLDTPEVFIPDFAIFTCDIKDYHHIPEHLTSFDKRPPKKN